MIGDVGYGVGVLGILFGLTCYYELWKWARQCQGARIAIAYKRKVKLQAPLTEWLAWCNNLDKDKDSKGRVIYTIGGTTVALIKKEPRRTWRQNRQIKKNTEGGAPSVREQSHTPTARV